MSAELEIEFPEHLLFLINEPARYKVLWGGRGAGKTEIIAIALIILASQRRLRIACFREFQNSIAESVHQTIKHRIYSIGLENEFDITDHSIKSLRTGSEFIFSGLRYNIDKIKSMARIDIAWIEEARNVSKYSWDKLAPTIRGRHESDKEGMGGPFGLGPEIWVSFNAELDEDETYKRFIINPPSQFDENGNRYAIIKKVNYTENKWFPSDLRMEMEELRKKNYDDYLHVWEGHTKQILDGAIYATELRQITQEGRIGKVPYDPSRPVHTFWDLGYSDHTAIWFVQKAGVEFNVIDYYQDQLQRVEIYLKYLQSLNYMYGTDYVPHDGDADTLASMSIASLLRKAGRKVIVVPRVSKKINGINAARTVMLLCNFDEAKTKDGLQCLRRYCWEVDEKNGMFSKQPKHDEYSHGADGFQTFALSLKSETATKKKKRTETNVLQFNPHGWMS